MPNLVKISALAGAVGIGMAGGSAVLNTYKAADNSALAVAGVYCSRPMSTPEFYGRMTLDAQSYVRKLCPDKIPAPKNG